VVFFSIIAKNVILLFHVAYITNMNHNTHLLYIVMETHRFSWQGRHGNLVIMTPALQIAGTSSRLV
jgi:hypothetical protein